MKKTLIALLLVTLAGCKVYEDGTPWESGPYKLHWIGSLEAVSLCQAIRERVYSDVVPKQVFSVGINDSYVVAKQHPNGDKSVTKYFVILRSYEKTSPLDPKALLGPMKEDEFAARAKSMNLPKFSKTIRSLE